MTLLPRWFDGAAKICKPPEPFISPSIALSIMQDAINLLAISAKGKSRIGTRLTMAIVEQNHHDKLFVVIPGTNQCRWIKKENDPDFRIISFDEEE
jgi:hypothetical protein